MAASILEAALGCVCIFSDKGCAIGNTVELPLYGRNPFVHSYLFTEPPPSKKKPGQPSRGAPAAGVLFPVPSLGAHRPMIASDFIRSVMVVAGRLDACDGSHHLQSIRPCDVVLSTYTRAMLEGLRIRPIYRRYQRC